VAEVGIDIWIRNLGGISSEFGTLNSRNASRNSCILNASYGILSMYREIPSNSFYDNVPQSINQRPLWAQIDHFPTAGLLCGGNLGGPHRIDKRRKRRRCGCGVDGITCTASIKVGSVVVVVVE
jgi:hypothetical protein